MSDLIIERDGPVTTITLDRPDRRNALSLELMNELIAALTDLDPSAEVAVLTASGPAFSAGHDLGELVGGEPEFFQELFDRCTALMETVHRIPQPVIARVHGIATAAGCQLVASCDLAVAADTAVFATPGVKIGLFCSTPMVPISRKIGRKAMMEMLLLGEMVDAADAHRLGLVNRVVEEAELDAAIGGMTAKIAAKSPVAIRMGKEAYYAQLDMDLADAYAHCGEVMTRNMLTHDAEEGIDAFLEKRDPVWEGR